MLKAGRSKVRVTVDNHAVDQLLDADEVQEDQDDKASRILNYQKHICPFDTGNMKAHLGIKKTSGGRGRQIGVFDKSPLPPVDYVLYVVNGHDTQSGTHVPAQPFIQRSLDAGRE